LFGGSSGTGSSTGIVTPTTSMLVLISRTFACPLMLFDSLE
jgi:hypothetical protein